MPRDDTTGVTGSGEMRFADVRVKVPVGDRIHSLEFETRAGFVEGLGIGLLGQAGFFENYSVAFDLPSGTFTIHF